MIRSKIWNPLISRPIVNIWHLTVYMHGMFLYIANRIMSIPDCRMTDSIKRNSMGMVVLLDQ